MPDFKPRPPVPPPKPSESTLNVNLRVTGLDGLFGDPRITEVLSLLQLIKTQGETLMALSEDAKIVLKRIDDASNELAADIQALLDRPNTTAEEFRAALEPKVAFLEALASNTNAPVPPVPPNPPVEG